jgi:hypothetical protein
MKKIVVRGIVKNTSSFIELGESKESDEKHIQEIMESLQNIVKTVMRDNKHGYITLKDCLIDVSAFAVIEIKMV